MISILRSAGLLLAMTAMMSCTDRSVLEEQAQAATTQRLIGTWDAHFHLDHPVASGPGFGGAKRDVNGQLAFLANRSLTRSFPLINVPSDYGVFDVDFSPLGFDPRKDNETPTAIAGWRAKDSVQIILANLENGIAVTMEGLTRGDSIVGTWKVWISRAAGGGGHFVMVRHR
jgi:hypothetical protein